MPKVAEVLCKSLKTRLPTMADEVSGGLLEKAWFVSGDSAFRVQRAAARGVPVRFSRVGPRERFHFVVWVSSVFGSFPSRASKTFNQNLLICIKNIGDRFPLSVLFLPYHYVLALGCRGSSIASIHP